MLIHYTRNIDSAKSIIRSNELWMKSVGKTKDENEIYHFMKEFNRYHYLHELNGILDNLINHKKTLEFQIIEIVGSLIENKNAWLNGLSYGSVFSDLIRDNSYLVCFTEDDHSNFHNQEYGDVSFGFDNDPLVTENNNSHLFIDEKIIYFDSQQLFNLQFNETNTNDEDRINNVFLTDVEITEKLDRFLMKYKISYQLLNI